MDDGHTVIKILKDFGSTLWDQYFQLMAQVASFLNKE